MNNVGIINSICSKKSYEHAKSKLIEMGIWDYIVFPVIDFQPKGQNINNIINNLKLRSENFLFVDDNIRNVNEVKYYCKNIMTGDTNNPQFIAELKDIIKNTNGKSRLDRYSIWENKYEDRNKYVSNYDFLKDSQITICLLKNPDDLKFKERIYELANRTNQLNFTKSSFSSLSEFEEYISDESTLHLQHGSVFVYDKYGDYGLVGFYAFDEHKYQFEHFYFSCRVLNMGVENAVYKYFIQSNEIKPYSMLETYMI